MRKLFPRKHLDQLIDRVGDTTTLCKPCRVNTTAKGEHVGEVERVLQSINGEFRCISSKIRDIGITRLPIVVIKAMIAFFVMWQNALRSKSSVSQEYIPKELVL